MNTGHRPAFFLTCCFALLFALAAHTQSTDSFQKQARHVNRGDAWQRHPVNVLSGFKNMYHAAVLQTGDTAYPWGMWFFGWASQDCNPGFAGCDAIYHARGKNLDTWEVYCGDDLWDASGDAARWKPVLAAQSKPYDAWHNGDPSVVFERGRFYMAYSATGFNQDGRAFGSPEDKDGYLYCVMGAVSEDGIHWSRSQQPLIVHEPDIGGKPDQNGVFPQGMYHRPSLLLEDGRWRLWFDYWNGGNVAMGYAEAPEEQFLKGGFKVLRAENNPLLPEWPNPCIVHAGGKYYAFADPSGYGAGWPGRQLAEAESDDGLTWKILGWIPPDADTPACHVPSAFAYAGNGNTWLVLFYACQIGGEPYDYRYDRIRYMKRKLP